MVCTSVAVCVLMCACSRSGVGAEVEVEALTTLEDGPYTLTIETAKEVGADNVPVRIPVNVKLSTAKDKWRQIKVESRKEWSGQPLRFVGVISGPDVKFGVTAIEKSSLITYHYVGKCSDSSAAAGTYSCLVDGTIQISGKWSLIAKPDK